MAIYSLVTVLAIFIPIVVAFLSHLVAKLPKEGAASAKAICILASYVTFFLVLSLILAAQYEPIETQLFVLPLPMGMFNVGLYVDHLALVPALLSSLFTALALTYNVYYLSPYNRAYKTNWEFNRSYSFILLFNGAMLGTLFSDNLLSLLIFWELISLCSYVLISFWSKDQFCLWAAIKCLIMTHIGSIALLVATIVIYSITGTLEIAEIGNTIPLGDPAISIVFPLLLVAVLPKTVLFPLHTWLPDGTVAPTSATVLFHVCGFQSGIYIIIRFFLDAFHGHVISLPAMPLPLLFGNISVWSFVISLIGAITLIIGAINGVIENDFKRIIAYSTISQLGYIVLAAGLATPLGVTASLFHMISHALYCGLLFLCAGAVIYATGKHDINEMGGLYRHMPITAICCLIGSLSLSSVPFFSDFASKYLIFNATIDSQATLLTMIAFIGGVLNVAIAIRLLHSVFMQKSAKSVLNFPIKDPPISMLAPMILASAALIIFGVVPAIPLDSLIIPAVWQIGFPINVVMPLGSIETTLGFWNTLALALSMVILTVTFISMTLYSRRVAAVYRESASEETFEPFLCGEDSNLLDGPHGYQFYYVLTNDLRFDNASHKSNIDRAYNALSAKFFSACNKLLRLDIRQSYFAAILSFIVGAVVIVLIAVLAG
ncbi:MAG: NADH-quinone oxidoreductase subunit L [Candidatus Bathyarchaeota archaeon]|nr:NADH-quinone oxidoreductase subunit L [Candidatus Bathyarchaeota archaeon]MDH5787091.1 NADH-quinone oxidoreductase subunit L [Candidatus Bathyarchaeota archaeon]